MSQLTLHLLGPPEIIMDGHPVSSLASDKVRALLFYLAAQHEERGNLARAIAARVPRGRLFGDGRHRQADRGQRRPRGRAPK